MYEYESRIGFSRCDVYKRLTLAGLIDMFQDCSTFQSEDIGFGFDVLEKQNAQTYIIRGFSSLLVQV